jgi:hypothetical protein
VTVHNNGRPYDGNGRNREPLINPNLPAVPLALVYERVNRQGKRYLVGRVGTAKFLIVPTGDVSRGEPVWQVFLGEWPRDGREEQNAALAHVETAGAR